MPWVNKRMFLYPRGCQANDRRFHYEGCKYLREPVEVDKAWLRHHSFRLCLTCDKSQPEPWYMKGAFE